MSSALPAFLDGQHLVETFGVAGLLLIVFAETGLLLGFFLPGDSLLFAAGYAATGELTPKLHPSIAVVVLSCMAVSIVGAQTGYVIGSRVGPTLFAREDSRLFKRSYVTKAEEVIEHYGVGKAIVLARFIPIVRTMLNPVAGVLQVPVRTFALWNVLGGLIWSIGVTLVGYWAGSKIPSIDRYLLPAVVVIVLLSAVPVVLEVRRARASAQDS